MTTEWKGSTDAPPPSGAASQDESLRTFPTPKQLGYTGKSSNVLFYWDATSNHLFSFDGRFLALCPTGESLFVEWFRENKMPVPSVSIGEYDKEAQRAIHIDIANERVRHVNLYEGYATLRDAYLAEEFNE